MLCVSSVAVCREHRYLSTVSVVRCQTEVLRRADHSSRGVLASVMCLSMIEKPQTGGLGLEWPQSQSGRSGEAKNLLPLSVFEPRTVPAVV
jgi:hypothetical protein